MTEGRSFHGTFTVRAQRGEMATALVLAALAAGIVYMSAGMPDGTLAAPGPGMFPLGLGAALLITSIGLFVRGLRMRDEDADLVLEIGHRQVWVALAALVAVGLVFEPLGYPITIFLFMLVLLRSFSTLGWMRAAVAAAVAAGVSWWFFVKLLGVNLPLGLLRMSS